MNALRARLRRDGRDVTAVAREAGLSRQAIYRMLDPSWDPLPAGFRAVARVLGVDPVALLSGASGIAVAEAVATLREAAGGDARAFERLPVQLSRPDVATATWQAAFGEVEQRLVLAAAAMAAVVWPGRRMAAWVAVRAPTLSPSTAFFFGVPGMPPERVVEATPEPMKRLNVFGAFSARRFADEERSAEPAARKVRRKT